MSLQVVCPCRASHAAARISVGEGMPTAVFQAAISVAVAFAVAVAVAVADSDMLARVAPTPDLLARAPLTSRSD